MSQLTSSAVEAHKTSIFFDLCIDTSKYFDVYSNQEKLMRGESVCKVSFIQQVQSLFGC